MTNTSTNIDEINQESASSKVTELIEDISKDKVVLVVDFDGVLASKSDDWIYQMPTEIVSRCEIDEERLLNRAEQEFGVISSGYKIEYRRHLLHQAALLKLEEPILTGPIFNAVKNFVRQGGKLCVLTARSGYHATERVRRFLRKEGIEPLQIYQVGREAPKSPQLKGMLDDFPAFTVIFADDSKSTVNQVATELESYSDRLRVLWVKHKELDDEEEEKLLRQAFKDIERAIEMRVSDSNYTRKRDYLEHARKMYIWFASQRSQSIRFYLTVLGATIAGLGASLLHEVTPGEINFLVVANSIVSGVLSVFLILTGWACKKLDERNASLVNAAKAPMKKLENEYSDRLADPTANIIGRSDEFPGSRYESLIKGAMYVAIGIGCVGIVATIAKVFYALGCIT